MLQAPTYVFVDIMAPLKISVFFPQISEPGLWLWVIMIMRGRKE
jgi:hypothetical protein